METTPPDEPNDSSDAERIDERLNLIRRVKNGANWFYLIAGASLVNSTIFLFGGETTFILGLGVTQMVDGFTSTIMEDLGGGSLMHAVGFGVNLVIVALLALAGYLGRNARRWPFILGMVFYALDALIYILFRDWPPVAFHAFGLFGLFNGLRAIKPLNDLGSVTPPLSAQPTFIDPQPYFPESSPQQSSRKSGRQIGSPRTFWLFVVILVGLALIALIPIVFAILFP